MVFATRNLHNLRMAVACRKTLMPNDARKTRRLTTAAVVVAWTIVVGAVAAQPYPDGLFAEVKTTKGTIVLQLEFEKTPMTVANFVGLAEGTIDNKALPPGTPFYDGSVFHRVVPGHVIQAGMPKAQERGPGYTIPNEIVTSLDHGRAGMVGMANSGPHTNSSQFYVTLGDRSYLDGNYTVFGHVVTGMDVVNAIAQGDTIEHVTIVRVGTKARAFKTDNVAFHRLVEDVRARVKADEERKAKEEADIIKARWPNAVVLKNQPEARAGADVGVRPVLVVVVREGEGERVQAGGRLKAIYKGQFLNGRPFCSSAEDGNPIAGDAAEPFEYEAGKTRITAGLDAALLDMRKGERRTVIVQGPLTYGASGFYGKDRPGEKRFVIPPNTTLVYEVEVLDIRQ
jgi:cyclophilin family peptidyl-prolyl cis-trans isomerase